MEDMERIAGFDIILFLSLFYDERKTQSKLWRLT
jgi:hypothetical protein